MGNLRTLPQRLREADDLGARVASSETWIGYENSLRIIEGWVLKQAALSEVRAGSQGSAVDRFCEFIAQAEYAD